jgi:hypothetical protein
VAPGAAVLPLPVEKGAKMLRVDLKAADIDYEDTSGLFFDFHSRRCELATLADAAGVSPRVVVCRACLTAWGCKSPAQPDGGEVLAKRKGVVARRRLKEAWSKTAT